MNLPCHIAKRNQFSLISAPQQILLRREKFSLQLTSFRLFEMAPPRSGAGAFDWTDFPLYQRQQITTKDNNFTPDSYRDDNKKYQSMKQHKPSQSYNNHDATPPNVATAKTKVWLF